MCFVRPPAPPRAGEEVGCELLREGGVRPGRGVNGLRGPGASRRARCGSAGREVACARSGLGLGSWVLGLDPDSAAQPQSPRLYNGDTPR